MILIIAYGILFFELGERLPIWNTYIGGGVLAAFFGTAIIRQLSLIPEMYLDPINEFIGGDTVGFTTIWIIILITGSVLSLEKKILLKSFVGYFPAILGGLVAAMAFGALGGLIFGIDPTTVILKYVLPVMGGGNGDVAVLGAAKRMDLMAYAQLSSRLGGGIVLIIASFLFSFWM